MLTWACVYEPHNVMAPHSLNPWACVKNRLRGRPPLFCYKSPAILMCCQICVQEGPLTDLNPAVEVRDLISSTQASPRFGA